MRALILAAGRGQRLGALTEDKPKCLLRVGGRPLLDWQIAALQGARLRDIAVVRGYRGDLLDGRQVTFIENTAWRKSGICASLMRARSWLEGRGGLVTYGDILYTADAVAALLNQPGEIVISYDPKWRSLWERRMTDPLSDVERFRLSSDGSVSCIGGQPRSLTEVKGQYMGLLKFSELGWRAITECHSALPPARRAEIDMTSMLQLLVAGGTRIDAVATPAGWMEIDTATDLELCEAMLAAGELVLNAGSQGGLAGESEATMGL